MMKINGISKLTIKGSNAVTRPLIKYVDGMYFGAFLRPGQTYSKVISLVPPVTYYYTNNGATIEPLPYACWNWGDGFVNDNKVRAFQGDFITITNSSNITIQDIIINGNNSNFIWGGKYQDYGIQLPNSGIKCLASTNIDISNVDVTEMGEDGILIDNMTNDVNLNNVKCVRNTRSALAWTGGHTLTAVDCDFDETGKGLTIQHFQIQGQV
ncbi:MAG: right-handed parallel beta-helix repeat-containing protein [Bacteroidetes bacterium]|nr:right-handed parallel beta-helix repeat-containing protein [Bacteroidota bacterium]